MKSIASLLLLLIASAASAQSRPTLMLVTDNYADCSVEEPTYHNGMSAQLQLRRPDWRIYCVGLSNTGYAEWDAWLWDEVVARSEPPYIVMSLGIRDAETNMQDSVSASATKLIDSAQTWAQGILIVGPPQRTHGVGAPARDQTVFNALADICATHGWSEISCYDASTGVELGPDGKTPTAAGYDQIVNDLATLIRVYDDTPPPIPPIGPDATLCSGGDSLAAGYGSWPDFTGIQDVENWGSGGTTTRQWVPGATGDRIENMVACSNNSQHTPADTRGAMTLGTNDYLVYGIPGAEYAANATLIIDHLDGYFDSLAWVYRFYGADIQPVCDAYAWVTCINLDDIPLLYADYDESDQHGFACCHPNDVGKQKIADEYLLVLPFPVAQDLPAPLIAAAIFGALAGAIEVARRTRKKVKQGITNIVGMIPGVRTASLPYISAVARGITTGQNTGLSFAIENSRLLKQLMIEASSTGKELWLDFDTADFAETMFFPVQLGGLVMRGNGAGLGTGGTVLRWRDGPAYTVDPWTGQQVPSSLFHFVNARDLDISGFTIQASHPLGRAFRSTSVVNEYTPPTNHVYRQVVLDAINGMCPGGWLFDQHESDRNNDRMRFDNCQAINLGRGQASAMEYADEVSFGWKQDHAQCRVFTFIDCTVSQTGYQTIFNKQNYGVMGRSFNWIGGAGNFLDAVFLEIGDSDPITVYGLNAEANKALYDATHTNRFSGQPVTLDTIRFAQDRMVDGDCVITRLNPGPLKISNVITDGPFNATEFIRYGPPAQGTPNMQNIASLIVENCTHRTSLDPDRVIIYPNSPANNPAEGLEPNCRVTMNKIDTKVNDIQTMRSIPEQFLVIEYP